MQRDADTEWQMKARGNIITTTEENREWMSVYRFCAARLDVCDGC